MKFQERLSSLGFVSYADYLKSEHWRRVQEAYRQSGRPVRCAVCGHKAICLHHHTYERLGAELLDDLTPLCSWHHDDVHSMLRGRNLGLSATAQVVEELRVAHHEGRVVVIKPEGIPRAAGCRQMNYANSRIRGRCKRWNGCAYCRALNTHNAERHLSALFRKEAALFMLHVPVRRVLAVSIQVRRRNAQYCAIATGEEKRLVIVNRALPDWIPLANEAAIVVLRLALAGIPNPTPRRPINTSHDWAMSREKKAKQERS